MRKFISERNLVIVLFIAAFVVFFFAQQETRRQEQLHPDLNAAAPLLSPGNHQEAANIIKTDSVKEPVSR